MPITLVDLKDFFMWCTIINFGLFLFCVVFMFPARSLAYRIHCKMFRLKPEQMDIVWYAFLGVYKVLLIIFVLVPYIALCIVT